MPTSGAQPVHDSDPVEVHIDSTGSSSPWPSGIVFPTSMDSHLAPYLTEQEYMDTISKCSDAIHKNTKKHFARGAAAAVVMLIFGVSAGVVGTTLYTPEYYDCTASQGECMIGETSATADCCIWWCCDEEYTAADFANNCDRIAPTRDDQCGTCNKYGCVLTRLDGEKELVPAENPWAVTLAFVLAAPAILVPVCGIGLPMLGICQSGGMPDKMQPHFAAWERKGLKVRFVEAHKRGKEHIQAKIIVSVPPGSPSTESTAAAATESA